MSSGVIEGRETQGSKQGKKAQKRLLIKKGNKGGKKSCRAEGAEVPVFLRESNFPAAHLLWRNGLFA